MTRVHNFSAGPTALPLEALERAKEELLDFNASGMSVMEMSHRGRVYEELHDEALSLVRRLLSVPDGYDVLFLQGGATQQFAQVPMNLLHEGKSGDYIVTGVWGKKAIKEAKHIRQARLAASTEEADGKFYRLPRASEYDFDSSASYVHITSNNTVMGTQFSAMPDTGDVPLICDMSSDIMGVPADVSRFAMIYAGAQKNLGPSGVTVVIVKKELVEAGRTDIPYFFQYRTHRDANSLANTAPTFAIYMLRNVLSWLEGQGGVAWATAQNKKKAELLYTTLESRPDFYRLKVEKQSRSVMNVTWYLPTAELDAECVADATAAGLVGLKGHKLVGGMRASLYNAVSYESVAALCQFLSNYKA